MVDRSIYLFVICCIQQWYHSVNHLIWTRLVFAIDFLRDFYGKRESVWIITVVGLVGLYVYMFVFCISLTLIIIYTLYSINIPLAVILEKVHDFLSETTHNEQ